MDSFSFFNKIDTLVSKKVTKTYSEIISLKLYEIIAESPYYIN